MERLRRNAIHVITLLLAAGVAATVIPNKAAKKPNQAYYEARVPNSCPNFPLLKTMDVDQATWDALSPDGMISAIYSGPDNHHLDFTLVSSTSSNAFHDPQICFRNQNWRLDQNEIKTLNIGGKNIPAVVLSMTNSVSGSQTTAIYFFLGPWGFTADPFRQVMSLTLSKTLGIPMGQGYFFRFIVLDSSGKKNEDLNLIQRFATEVFDALKKSIPEATGA
jgi:hypothetical protein